MRVDDTAFSCCEGVAETDHVSTIDSLHLRESSGPDHGVSNCSPDWCSVKVIAERVVHSILPELDSLKHCYPPSVKRQLLF